MRLEAKSHMAQLPFRENGRADKPASPDDGYSDGQEDPDPPESRPGSGVAVRLSPAGYFADFAVYPPLSAALLGYGLFAAPGDRLRVLLVFAGGLAFWTFAEYFLHRIFFHHVPGCMELHEAHHRRQKELIGTPTWMSLGLFALLVVAPAYWLARIPEASAFAAGMMLGYTWYVAVHYGMHHWKARPDSYFFRLKRRHALHHHYNDMGNFGVTTGFWDHVFRTNLNIRREAGRR
jgi:sterol desaturase/sphingolipid hydroxylase (fatty acid hydroxylase superfamily)